jgi:cytochrome P450
MIPPGPAHPVSLQDITLQTLESLAHDHGGIVTVRPQIYLISEPALIEEILVARPGSFRKGQNIQRVAAFLGRGLLALDGDEWRRHRRLIQPAFGHSYLEAMGPNIVSLTESHIAQWPAEFDAHKVFVELLMQITMRNIFQLQVTAEIRDLMESWEVLFAHLGNNRFAEQGPPPAVDEAKQRVDEILRALISRQRSAGADGSLLGRLVTARDDGGSGLNDDELCAEVMTLFVGGYETGATALTFAVGFLSTHPDVAARHLAEIAGHLGTRAATYSDLASMPLNHAVLQETLRLAPPSWMFTRELIDDGRVGKYELEAGSQLLISPWVVHHDPRWWPDPHRFIPERFAADASQRPRMSWIPFGAGPRKCLGSQLAMIELQLILATLVRKVQLKLVEPPLVPVAKLGLGSTTPAIVTREPPR